MRRLRSWLINLFLICAVIIAGLLVVPSLLGYERYVITSGSMTGTIDKGSVVYSQVVPADTLKVGDIITFKPPAIYQVDDLVTHRIHSISHPHEAHGNPVFRTKGDANPDPDPWEITLDDDKGPLVKAHLPYVGYVYLALAIPWVRFLLITIPALLIGILTVISVWREAGREAEAERQALKDAHPAEKEDAEKPKAAA
jgi:signal peptidase